MSSGTYKSINRIPLLMSTLFEFGYHHQPNLAQRSKSIFYDIDHESQFSQLHLKQPVQCHTIDFHTFHEKFASGNPDDKKILIAI